uniref:Retrovirus-related Pol polyprotein from transposon TNT 1-94 n=1 Tax=Tanacetum cinerariifolium TaxID=118510 RepID=A0A6L2M0S6_TANCI|nr:hypothetical protein [Tanacetum cinerariifolium]
MAAVNDVPQLVDKKGGSYAAIAPKLEPGKFNKWKKQILCYLAGMEPYYLKCIKDNPFQPKTTDGDAKPKSQWTPDERRVDFQENCDDEVDERSSEEYLRDLDVDYRERSLLANSKRFIKKETSQVKKQMKILNVTNVATKKDYKAEYKKMKAKLVLLEESPSSPQNPKTFQPKSKTLVVEILDWDEEEVSDDEKVNQVKVLMAFADDELTVRKSHARNGEWVDITIRKLRWPPRITLGRLLPHARGLGFKTRCGGFPSGAKKEWGLSPKAKVRVFHTAQLDVTFKRLNPDSKIPNFNTIKILAPEIQAVNESFETLNTPESSKDFEAGFLTPLPLMKNLQGASLSSKVMPLTFQPHSSKKIPGLGIMKHTKPETQDSSNKSVLGTVTVSEIKQITPLVPTKVKDTKQESNLNELTKLVQMLIDEKVNSNQETQESTSKIQKTESSKLVVSSKMSQDSKHKVQNTGLSKSLKPKSIHKPQLKCELCHYTNHSTDDCYRTLYYMICKREDHRTSDHESILPLLKEVKAIRLSLISPDLAGKPVNETSYRGMIGSLMYLTATRPGIQFSISMCKVLVQSKGITSNSCEKNTQHSVAMSSAEAEYVVADGCCASILWMKSQLSNYDIHYKMVPYFVTTPMPLQYPTIQYFTQEPSILILDIISFGITFIKEILNYTPSSLSIS